MTVKEYNYSVSNYADNVYRFVLKNLRNEEKAKDIVQDAFEKVWHKREKVDGAKAKSYLFTTAYRCMIDSIRREKKQGSWNEVQENSLFQHQVESDLNDVLEEALNRLPELQRSLVLLRDYEGYDYKEIGEIANLSMSQVKVYIFRARKALKDYLVSIEKVI
ncbi:MAG: RNA polymerase subunit sigma-24 [Flavobacteriales bacterium]|nr:RNA polymerase subunit sigma-24 [Flavobacteriales bacterium]|tara:strand:- start:30654 stop:31139 length:486 start_codon:yes stop_codon:yes gene_type:complete